jgi:uncharacterized GH25 family protein
MRTKSSSLFLLCVLAGAFLFVSHVVFSENEQTPPAPAAQPAPDAQPAPPPAPPAQTTPNTEELNAKIARLIEQLGAAEFEDREAAQKELTEIGERARTALAKALKHDDKEISYRASQVLIWLNLAHVTLQVTDRQGKPIANAKVHLTITEPPSFSAPMEDGEEYLPSKPTEVEATSSADGGIALEPLTSGNYYVAVNVEGYGQSETQMTFGRGTYTRKVILYRGGSIKFKVVDVKNDNKPLANITLHMYGDRSEMKEYVTDQNGEFLLQNLPPGKQHFYLNEWRDKYIAADREKGGDIQADVKDEEITEVTVSVMEQKWRYGKVEGKILGPDGKPYEGTATITYGIEREGRTEDYGGGGNSSENKNGEFSLDNLEAGKYSVIVQVQGYAVRIVRGIEVKGNETTKLPQDIKLEKGTPLKISVLDREGKPVPEAIVFLANAEDPPRPIQEWLLRGAFPEDYYSWNTLKTGADGRCEFALSDGKYAVRAYYGAGGMSEEAIVEVKAGGNPAAVDITYKTAAMIALTAVDKATGKAVQNVQAEFCSMLTRGFDWPEAEPKHEGHIYMEFSPFVEVPHDDKGRFCLRSSSKGDKLVLCAQGYRPAIYSIDDVPAGKLTEATCEMEPLGTGDLKVTLVPGKDLKLENIAEAYVNSIDTLAEMHGPDAQALFFRWGTKTVPDKNGMFEVKALNEGTYYVSLFDKGGKFVAVFRTTVEKGKTADVKLNVPGVGKIEGTLTDAAGNTLPGMEVMLMPDSMTMSLGMFLLMELGPLQTMPTTIADENGRFTFDSVPEGDYVLMPNGQAGIPETRLVSVTGGDTANADMQLHEPMDVALGFKEKTGTSPVIILAENSAGPLHLVIPPSRDAVIFSFFAEPAKLNGVRPGKHVLILLGGGAYGSLHPIEVKPDTQSIDVEGPLERGAQSIKGKITRLSDVMIVPQGVGLILAVGERSFALGCVLPDGTFEIHRLQPDKYRLMPVSLAEACTNRADVLHLTEVTVEPGKDVEGVEIP